MALYSLAVNLESKVRTAVAAGELKRPCETVRGVTKRRIEEVLRRLDLGTRDQVDVVFALLDNQTPCFFNARSEKSLLFCDGATTAHIGCHVGVLQRGAGKLDREGRDYWLKPLWEIGALEKVYFDRDRANFLPGHPKSKSPNSAYRIAGSFVDVLTAEASSWESLLNQWKTADATRARLHAQAALADATRAYIGSPHEALIQAARAHYAATFLPGFRVLYVDAADGDRITQEDRDRLATAGIQLTLNDSMPDVLLWNPDTDWLWVIEAVTSDGEVDSHKVDRLRHLAGRHGKAGVGFTTAYLDWKTAAKRQGRHRNLAPGTYLWIQEDGMKQFRIDVASPASQSA